MDTPLKSRSTAILGSATIPGRPEEVSGARAFVTRTLSAAEQEASDSIPTPRPY